LRDLDKQIIGLLSNLGFDPAARARLGLAEVKTKTKLEALREKQK
jgi:phage terminase small subunit